MLLQHLGFNEMKDTLPPIGKQEKMHKLRAEIRSGEEWEVLDHFDGTTEASVKWLGRLVQQHFPDIRVVIDGFDPKDGFYVDSNYIPHHPEIFGGDYLSGALRLNLMRRQIVVFHKHHLDVFFSSGGESYQIGKDQLNTPSKVLGWIFHFCGKSQITREHIRALIVAAEKLGVKVDRSP